jgi:Na+/phosphate symporter
MTSPLLEYQSAASPSNLRSAAFVFLLILGILYALGSSCLGVVGIVTFLDERPHLSNGRLLLLMSFPAVLVGDALGTAVTYIWTGILIQRHSRKASVVTLIVSLINVIVSIIFLTLLMVLAAYDPGVKMGAIVVGALLCAFAAALNIVAAWLTRRLLREPTAQGGVEEEL